MVESTLPLQRIQSATTKDQERRGAIRFLCNLDTSCRPLMARDGYTWPAQVRDISRGGVGLIAARRFERGTVLVLDLESPDQKITHTVLARVAHSTPREEGKWFIGCAFTSELDDEDMQVYGVHRVRPNIPDCRAWVRVPVDMDASCQPPGSDSSSPWVIKVVNLSPAGMGLLAPRPVEKGALLYLELLDASGKEERPVLVRVVHQQASPEGWQLGCEFASQLTEEQIQGFLE